MSLYTEKENAKWESERTQNKLLITVSVIWIICIIFLQTLESLRVLKARDLRMIPLISICTLSKFLFTRKNTPPVSRE